MNGVGQRGRVVLAMVVVLQLTVAGVGATTPATATDHAPVAAPNSTDNETKSTPTDERPPPGGPDHGINATTWWKLWSGDTDNPDLNYSDISRVNTSEQAARQMANASDFVFERPPKAVETWNEGEHSEWTGTDRNTSRYPRGTDLTQGTVIKDAYVRIVSMGPSTIVHRQNNTSQWIAPHGRTLAIVDYRVQLPENESTTRVNGNKTVVRWTNWTFVSSRIGRETLTANGTEFARTRGEYAPNFSYYSVPSNVNALETNFTVEATIKATLLQITRTCSDYNTSNGTCNGTWTRDLERKEYDQTVEDKRHVQVQRLDDVEILPFVYNYKDLTGARVTVEEPWRAINVTRHETVRSTWWFYTRQKSSEWSTMIVEDRLTKTEASSTLRPLEVHAVPTQYKPSVQPNSSSRPMGNLTLESTRVPERKAPTLPSTINVELAKRYKPIQEVRVRSRSYEKSRYEYVTVRGVVRGVKDRRHLHPGDRAYINEIDRIYAKVSPAISNSSVAGIRVIVFMTDKWAIDRGTVVINGERKDLDGDIMVEFYLDRPIDRPLTVRYEHAEWRSYRMSFGDAETTMRSDSGLPSVDYVLRIALAAITALIMMGGGLVGVDRMTKGKLLGLSFNK